MPEDWAPGAGRLPSAWTVRGALFRFLIWGWDNNLTPGRVIRGVGPLGPGLVHRYARGRFQQGLALSDAEVDRFESYFYHILAARGSGEFALRHILAPFAWPRQALEDRCANLKVPVTFFYGVWRWKCLERDVPELSRVDWYPFLHLQVTLTGWIPRRGHVSRLNCERTEVN